MVLQLLFLSSLVYSLAINHKFHQLSRMGTSVKSLVTALIFEKGVRLHAGAGGNLGSTTNLISNDCERLFEAGLFLHYMWA
jgi:hypothetical protein